MVMGGEAVRDQSRSATKSFLITPSAPVFADALVLDRQVGSHCFQSVS